MPKSSFSKHLFVLFLGLSSLASTALASAPIPSGIQNISDAKISQLEGLHKKAEDYILKNNFSKAIDAYQDILLEEPDDETAYTGLGQCYMVVGDFTRAQEAYRNALHINPNNETALLGLKKIADPDSLNFTEESPVKTDVKNSVDASKPQEVALPTPIPATIPVRYPKEVSKNLEIKTVSAKNPPAQEAEDPISLGARKAMAPYSADIPNPLRELNHEQLIQVALKNAGFYRGPVDGVMGPVTRKAVRSFQNKYELAADGKVGPQTWALLQPYLYRFAFDEKILRNGTSL